MATWDNVVYTTLGLNLMAKLQTGASLEITRAVGGDGHAGADALTALTEITARQALTLSNAVYKGNGQALLPVTLYNRGLTAGYPLRQIGIYATDPDDGEVLMLVAQSEQPDTIPSEADSPDFVTNFSFHVALGNAGRINVSYSLTDMATKADYVAFVEQIEGKLGQPGGIATLNDSGKIMQMPTAADVGAVPVSQYRPMGPYYSDGATAGVKDVIYYACDGITTGAYQLLATGNHNPGGSPNYRSVYVAIIGISVGYNYDAKRQVVRCEIIPLLFASNDTGQYKPVEAYLDNKAGGSATEIPYTAGPYKLFVRLIRNDTTSQDKHWDVRLHKLI